MLLLLPWSYILHKDCIGLFSEEQIKDICIEVCILLVKEQIKTNYYAKCECAKIMLFGVLSTQWGMGSLPFKLLDVKISGDTRETGQKRKV